MNRRKSRETAFALLFEWSFTEEPLDEMIKIAPSDMEGAVDDFAYSLAERSIARHAEADELIERFSKNWKLGRISKVTLAALRLAFCEMAFFEDIPAGATINEAVELVKKYGTEDEAAYLNGILGAYERSRRSGGEEG